MSKIYLLLALSLQIYGFGATFTEPVWPAWVGVSKGASTVAADKGVDQDDHDNYDYGSDKWGWWANVEIMSGATVVAVVEMRYINIIPADYGQGAVGGAYLIGAAENEQGAVKQEMPKTTVALAKVNGGSGFWMSAEECSQEVWEKVNGIIVKQKQTDSSDINNVDTVAFAGLKSLRAVESQTLANVKNFCAIFGGVTTVTGTVRLPTEYEWEYACRAGTATAFWTGRLLDGVYADPDLVGTSVVPSGMAYNYRTADMVAQADSAPYGDGGLTPAWEIKIQSVDGDGVANFDNGQLTVEIGGKLTISGGILTLEVAALFDDRYQHRYVADHYGTHTPILMLYYFDGADFIPRPYGDPTAADMYYRYLELSSPGVRNDPADYIRCNLLNTTTGAQNRQFSYFHDNKKIVDFKDSGKRPKLDKFYFREGTEPGDWYAASPLDWATYGNAEIAANAMVNADLLTKIKDQYKQLEYREMIPVTVRFTAGGVEDIDGSFVKDFNGVLYPIRSLYTPIPFWTPGNKRSETLPTTNVDLEAIARQVDQSSLPDPKMNTDDYVEAVRDAIVNEFSGKVSLEPGFYTGTWTGFSKFRGWENSIFPRSRIMDKIEVAVGAAVDVQVGTQGRNPWGLFNMHGNVEEWVDTKWDGKSGYDNVAAYDSGPYQITRGGSWRTGADRCRSAARTARDPNKAYNDVGFRFIIE